MKTKEIFWTFFDQQLKLVSIYLPQNCKLLQDNLIILLLILEDWVPNLDGE